MVTDQEVIARHDVGARHRAAIELKIVRRLVADAEKAGFKLKIQEYEEEQDDVYERDIVGALFNLDDAHLQLHNDEGFHGWVYLVFGNDGYDVISDYTVNLESLVGPINEFSDELLESGQ